MNDVEAIEKTVEKTVEKYYRTTILSSETDPNKLNDLESDLIVYQVYTKYHVDSLVELYLNGAQRDKLDLILDVCVNIYAQDLDEDGQVDFKSKAKMFSRTYGFLSAILPYGNAEWEKLSTFLISKLPPTRYKRFNTCI